MANSYNTNPVIIDSVMVAGASRTSNVDTFTTQVAHLIGSNWTVTTTGILATDSGLNVTSQAVTGVTSTTVTVAQTASNATGYNGTISGVGPSVTVTASAIASNVLTFTVASHTLSVGNVVTATGFTPASFNVTKAVVTATTGTTVSVALTAANVSGTVQGTIVGATAAPVALNGTLRAYLGSGTFRTQGLYWYNPTTVGDTISVEDPVTPRIMWQAACSIAHQQVETDFNLIEFNVADLFVNQISSGKLFIYLG